MDTVVHGTFDRLKNGRVRGWLYTPDGRRRRVYGNTQAEVEQEFDRIVAMLARVKMSGLSERTYREHYLRQVDS